MYAMVLLRHRLVDEEVAIGKIIYDCHMDGDAKFKPFEIRHASYFVENDYNYKRNFSVTRTVDFEQVSSV
jgi:hypothetical protein